MKHKNSNQTLSPRTKDYQRKLNILAWSVRAILEYDPNKHSKTLVKLTFSFALPKRFPKTQRSFLIYRREIYRLLNAEKNARDQLMFELPCLMGFRSGEIGRWRIEHIDFQNGETLVFDSKKKTLLPMPLNVHVANLAMKVAGSRREGYVLKNRSRAHRGWTKPITQNAVWLVWQKYAHALDLFPKPSDYSPIVGRRFFAAEWFYTQKLSVVTLSRIMRHSHPMQTLDYVAHIMFAEDVKRDYDRFQFRVMQDNLKVETT